LGQLDAPHTQNSGSLGTPLVKVFEVLTKNGFHDLKKVLSCSGGTIELKKVFSDLLGQITILCSFVQKISP
jgi:hypothetical protein